MSTILIADDEKNILSGLRMAFEDEGYTVIAASDGTAAWEALNSNIVDLVLTDLRMPGMSGSELVERIHSSYPMLPCIVLTGHGTIETAVETMRLGAVDFFTKPVDLEKLLLVVRKCIDNSNLREQNKKLTQELETLRSRHRYSQIIGKSSRTSALLDTIAQVAPSKATVLVTGESGTGKELVADALEAMSGRHGKAFVKVHCASLSPTLLESELFGHEKGAFTGAVGMKKGRFELADGGTIFLDEIGEIDAQTQVKLLRVLQNREFERVGGEKTIQVDVRVICATNRNLEEEVRKGNFREDLFFRLNVVEIHVPPLRERKEDIEMLAVSFLRRFAEENGKRIDSISAQARKALFSYHWPGNIRELENAVESAVVMCRTHMIETDDLPAAVRAGLEEKARSVMIPLPVTMEEAEKTMIMETIAWCGGNKTRAAEVLGIGRKTLHRKLAEWKEGEEE